MAFLSMTPLEALAPWAISQACAIRQSPLAPLCCAGLPRRNTGSFREGGAWVDGESVMCNGCERCTDPEEQSHSRVTSEANQRRRKGTSNRLRVVAVGSNMQLQHQPY